MKIDLSRARDAESKCKEIADKVLAYTKRLYDYDNEGVIYAEAYRALRRDEIISRFTEANAALCENAGNAIAGDYCGPVSSAAGREQSAVQLCAAQHTRLLHPSWCRNGRPSVGNLGGRRNDAEISKSCPDFGGGRRCIPWYRTAAGNPNCSCTQRESRVPKQSAVPVRALAALQRISTHAVHSFHLPSKGSDEF